jgi:hypothetical protein
VKCWRPEHLAPLALAKLPPDMNRVILEFKLGVVVQR